MEFGDKFQKYEDYIKTQKYKTYTKEQQDNLIEELRPKKHNEEELKKKMDVKKVLVSNTTDHFNQEEYTNYCEVYENDYRLNPENQKHNFTPEETNWGYEQMGIECDPGLDRKYMDALERKKIEIEAALEEYKLIRGMTAKEKKSLIFTQSDDIVRKNKTLKKLLKIREKRDEEEEEKEMVDIII
jgi:hypothetical protein